MKAAAIERFGPPSVLRLGEMPTPAPRNGELLVRIEAAGINRLDHYIREGTVVPSLPFPHVLGSDAVGIVEAVGAEVEGFAPGDRVIPMPGYPMDPDDAGAQVLSTSPSYAIRGLVGQGTYAEFMTVPARWTVPAPAGDAAELAALPMPLVTAVQAVRRVGEVAAGDTVVVHAGASGTGSMMIQVARALGARVASTVRTPEKRAFVESLGAEAVFPMDGDLAGAVREWTGGAGADVVLDNLGGPSVARSLEAVRPLGIVVLMGNVLGLEATIPVRAVFFPGKQIRGTLMGGLDDLRWGLAEVAAGRIRPILDRTFPLGDAAAAHERLAAGAQTGNIVLDVAR